MRISLLFIFVFFIFGCTANNVPYKRADISAYFEFTYGGDVGYFEEEVGQGSWRVKYIGLPDTDYALLESYLKRRASELCESQYDVSNYIETGSVVAHRVPSVNRYVEAVITCIAS